MTNRNRIGGLLLGELVLAAGLHALARLDGFGVPWREVGAWLDHAPFEDAVGVVLLLVARALAYWLLVSTIVYLLASASGRPRLLRAVRWATLPPIRGLAGRVVALSISASTIGGPLAPAMASPAPSDRATVTFEVGSQGQLPPSGTEGSERERNSRILVPPHLESPRRPAEPTGQEAEPTGSGPPNSRENVDRMVANRITVRPGDHMWSLSERHLQKVTGRLDLGEHEIARYWVRVIENNRTRIRSGNPDLIYPGEILVLPPVEW